MGEVVSGGDEIISHVGISIKVRLLHWGKNEKGFILR